MQLKSLLLQNYRNYARLELDLHPQLTLFVGKNGSGKTNVLESVRYLTAAQSFRVKRDLDLISWEEDYARMEGVFDNEGRDHRQFSFLERQILRNGNERVKKTFSIFDKKVRPVEFVGNVSSVIFSPQDMQLLTDSPGTRRRYIDSLLSQVDPSYYHNLVQYKKTVKQRNAVLDLIMKNQASSQQLEPWDEQLILHGSFIIEKRDDFFSFLSDVLGAYYAQMSGADDSLESVYEKNTEIDTFSQLLIEHYPKESHTGHTSVGPHRDDFVVHYNGKNIVDCGSRGEFRSTMLAFKKAEAEYIHLKTKNLPILLLDDVFSELDEQRRALLIDFASSMQTIITTTDLDAVGDVLLEDSLVYEVSDGICVLKT